MPQGSDPPVGGKDCAEIARLHTAFILRPKSMKCMICFTFSKRNENVASGREFLGVQRILQKKVSKGHFYEQWRHQGGATARYKCWPPPLAPSRKFHKHNILFKMLIVPVLVHTHQLIHNPGYFL